MEMCPCWGLGVRGGGMVPSKGEFLQNPEAANHLALTYFGWEYEGHRMSLPVNDCIKAQEKTSSCPQLKVSSCCEEVTFLALYWSPKDSLSRAGMWEAKEVSRYFPLSHFGGCLLSPRTQSLLIGKGITQSFFSCLSCHSQSFFCPAFSNWMGIAPSFSFLLVSVPIDWNPVSSPWCGKWTTLAAELPMWASQVDQW